MTVGVLARATAALLTAAEALSRIPSVLQAASGKLLFSADACLSGVLFYTALTTGMALKCKV